MAPFRQPTGRAEGLEKPMNATITLCLGVQPGTKENSERVICMTWYCPTLEMNATITLCRGVPPVTKENSERVVGIT